ncbi:hypothetical protein LC574_02410, partial [Nostoc sp. CHAB 5715]|nr:hypothetical protein [Nostoc sp. CHAB 5715]
VSIHRAALKDKQGANEIAYKMGETGAVDIQEVLALMAALNLDRFPDENKHPNVIFGQPANVLRIFAEDTDNEETENGFAKMLPKLHDVLILHDRVMEECARYTKEQPRLALLNRRKGKENQKKKPRPAYFANDRMIDRRIFIGLIYPIFSAFRANVSPTAWQDGKFEWIVPPCELLNETIDQLCEVIRQAYVDNNGVPATIGKKQAAYLACYQVVLLRLARKGKLALD